VNAFYEEKVFLKDLYPAWCLTYGPDIGGKTQSVQFFRGDAESRESRFRLQNGDVGVAGFVRPEGSPRHRLAMPDQRS